MTRKYEIDIKFARGGHIAPVLSDLKVVDVCDRFGSPTEYAYIEWEGTEEEFNILHSKLIVTDRFFKVVGIHELEEK